MATGALEPTDVPMYSTMLKNPELGHLATPTCTITSKKDEAHPMRAVEFHGKQDMKVKTRPRPLLTDPVSAFPNPTRFLECNLDVQAHLNNAVIFTSFSIFNVVLEELRYLYLN